METTTEPLSDTLPRNAVLVAVDGSEGAERAQRWAVAHARLAGRPLLLVQVYDLGGGVGGGMWLNQAGIDVGGLLAAVEEESRQQLAAARDRALADAPDLEVHTLLRHGDPREALIALSADADLVVMGSRGHGPIRSMLLGSVSVAVAKHAGCPVVVVRPGLEAAHRGVLVGADGTADSRPAIEFAFREADLRRLPLTVLHTFWDVEASMIGAHQVPSGHPAYADLEMLVAASIGGLRDKYPDVQVTPVLWRGLADDCLVRASDGMHLVVVGHRHHRPLSERFFSSVAPVVVEHARSAVAVIPHDAETG